MRLAGTIRADGRVGKTELKRSSVFAAGAGPRGRVLATRPGSLGDREPAAPLQNVTVRENVCLVDVGQGLRVLSVLRARGHHPDQAVSLVAQPLTQA